MRVCRSDVLGQLMPIVGRDWSHTGVAELFTKIKRSGYYILYLTARAIGQADATRDYLFGLTQKERDKLPGICCSAFPLSDWCNCNWRCCSVPSFFLYSCGTVFVVLTFRFLGSLLAQMDLSF